MRSHHCLLMRGSQVLGKKGGRAPEPTMGLVSREMVSFSRNPALSSSFGRRISRARWQALTAAMGSFQPLFQNHTMKVPNLHSLIRGPCPGLLATFASGLYICGL